MCGRFVVHSASEHLRDLLGVGEIPEGYAASYNVAVTEPVLIARSADAGASREAAVVRWGLIPWWAKDAKIANRCFNARSEDAHEKPAFRDAFARRRCLVAADGFYEWEKQGRARQPWYFHFADRRPFAFAGLWERWRGPDGLPVETCTILTTGPNELVEPFHDRMAVILRPEDFDLWLDPETGADRVRPLFAPFPAAEMAAHRVRALVNGVDPDGPELILPFEPEPPAQRSLF